MFVNRPNDYNKDFVMLQSVYISGMVMVTNLFSLIIPWQGEAQIHTEPMQVITLPCKVKLSKDMLCNI